MDRERDIDRERKKCMGTHKLVIQREGLKRESGIATDSDMDEWNFHLKI